MRGLHDRPRRAAEPLEPAFVIAQDFLPLQHPVDPMKLISPRDRAEPSTLRVRLEPDNPAERCDRWGAIGRP